MMNQPTLVFTAGIMQSDDFRGMGRGICARGSGTTVGCERSRVRWRERQAKHRS
jgi:hypothetical protein